MSEEQKQDLTLEQSIKDVLSAKLSDGTVERIVEEQITAAISKAVGNLTSNYGDLTKLIEKKIKDVMLPQVETYDFSKHLIKLDTVLTEILKNTAIDHTLMLENFKDLMIGSQEEFKTMTTEKIFAVYCDYVAHEVDTSELEVCTDDEPHYENVNARMTVEDVPQRFSSSSYKNKVIILECEEDEKLNRRIELTRFMTYPWRLENSYDTSIRSIRNLDKFDLFLVKLSLFGSEIVIDKENEDEEVDVEAQPEVSFN